MDLLLHQEATIESESLHLDTLVRSMRTQLVAAHLTLCHRRELLYEKDLTETSGIAERKRERDLENERIEQEK